MLDFLNGFAILAPVTLVKAMLFEYKLQKIRAALFSLKTGKQVAPIVEWCNGEYAIVQWGSQSGEARNQRAYSWLLRQANASCEEITIKTYKPKQ